MAIIRWNPGTDLMNLHSEMDRLFDELVGGMGLQRAPRSGGMAAQAAFLPLDIERTDDALVIRASVPGFTPEEVTVTVDQGVLTIDAQHVQDQEEKDRSYLRQERFIGRLFRQIALGPDVRSEDAQATFDDGVLTIVVPLAKRAEPRRIPVQPSEVAAAAPTGNGASTQAAGNGSAEATSATGGGAAEGLESVPVTSAESS